MIKLGDIIVLFTLGLLVFVSLAISDKGTKANSVIETGLTGALSEGLVPPQPGSAPGASEQDDVASLTLETVNTFYSKQIMRDSKKAMLAKLLSKRKTLLSKLMKKRFSQASKHIFDDRIISDISSSQPQLAQYLEKPIYLNGDFYSIHADLLDGSSGEEYAAVQNGIYYSLHFGSDEPVAAKGAKIAASGYAFDNSVLVEESVVTEPTSDGPPDAKKIAVILFNFNNENIEPVSPDQVKQLIFTGPSSVKKYYEENSFSQLTLTGVLPEGDVFGWYTLPFDAPNENVPCIWADIFDKWMPAADRLASDSGVDFSKYDYYHYIFPGQMECGFSGIAMVPGTRSALNLVPKMLDFSTPYFNHVSAHELGHNLGLHHANYYQCTQSVEDHTVVSLSETCRTVEYGDPFGVMGGKFFYHLNNFNKARLGWLSENDVLTITSKGIYSLSPLETKGNNPVALRIPLEFDEQTGVPTTYYYVEYRQLFGFDDFDKSAPAVNGVLIRQAPDYSIVSRTNLLTMHAIRYDSESIASDLLEPAPLLVGEFFRDMGHGIIISLLSAGESGATVQVDFQPPQCIRRNPNVLVTPPQDVIRLGRTFDVSASIENKDSDLCPNSLFFLDFDSYYVDNSNQLVFAQFPYASSVYVPAGSPRASVSLKPGEFGKVTVALTPLDNSKIGINFNFNGKVSRPDLSQVVFFDSNVLISKERASCKRGVPQVELTTLSQSSKIEWSRYLDNLVYDGSKFKISVKNTDEESCGSSTFRIVPSFPNNRFWQIPAVYAGLNVPAVVMNVEPGHTSAAEIAIIPGRRLAGSISDPLLPGKYGVVERVENSQDPAYYSEVTAEVTVASPSASPTATPVASPSASPTATPVASPSPGVSPSPSPSATPMPNCETPPSLKIISKQLKGVAGLKIPIKVLIKDNNPRTCGNSAYSVAPQVSDLNWEFSDARLKLAAGSSKYAKLSIVPPADAPLKKYIVDVVPLKYTSYGAKVFSSSKVSLPLSLHDSCQQAKPLVSMKRRRVWTAPGKQTLHTLTIKNTANKHCSPSDFTISSLLPHGWKQNPDLAKVNIPAQKSISLTFKVSSAANAAPGFYEVKETAFNNLFPDIQKSVSIAYNIKLK